MTFVRKCACAVAVFLMPLAAYTQQWFATGEDPAYPRMVYFVGVGMSRSSLDEAKNNAVVEVKKQISVNINASVLDKQESLIQGGSEVSSMQKSESRARLTTRGEVQGIEVAKTAQQDGIFYSLAVLDKQNFASNCKAKIGEQSAALERYMSAARDAIGAGNIAPALTNLGAARQALTSMARQRTLLSAAEEISMAQKFPYTVTDIDLLYEKCITSITMEKISGDRQKMQLGEAPNRPLVIAVSINNTPAGGVPVNLVTTDDVIVDTRYTSDNGRASFELLADKVAGTGTHKFTVQLGLQVSGRLKRKLFSEREHFLLKVEGKPVAVDITVNVADDLLSASDKIKQKLIVALSQQGLGYNPSACARLTVNISATEGGYVQGLSASRTFLRTNVDASFTLAKKGGQNLQSFSASGKGMGSTKGNSVAKAIEKLSIRSQVPDMLSALQSVGGSCGGTSAPTASRSTASQPARSMSRSSGDGATIETAEYLPKNKWVKGTLVNGEKWYWIEVQANESYYLHADGKHGGSGNYSTTIRHPAHNLIVYRSDMMTKLEYEHFGRHYVTDPSIINAPATERIYVKVTDWHQHKNTNFALKIRQKD